MEAALLGGPIRLLDSPIRYMKRRVEGPTRWFTAILPVTLYVMASTAGALVAGKRMNMVIHVAMEEAEHPLPDVPFLLGVLVAGGAMVVAAMLTFALHVGTLVALDLFFVQSGRVSRLVELAMVSYWTQAVYALVGLFSVVLFFEPESLRIPPGTSSIGLQQLIEDYYTTTQRVGFSTSLLTSIRQMVNVWLIALHACALRVVSGFSVGSAWAAGVFLTMLFVVGPIVVQGLI